MPLPQTTRDAAPDDQEPSTKRLFRVAAGLDSWTTEELALKNRLPWWTIRMAITQSTLLQLAQSDAEFNARLSKIVHELKTFQEPHVFEAAADYVEVYLPENQRHEFRRLLKPPIMMAAPVVASNFHNSDRRKGVLAVIVAAVALVALALFISPFTQDSRFQNTLVMATVTFENRGTTRSTSQDIYSDDRVVYKTEIVTQLSQAWLIHMNDNDQNIDIHSARNVSGRIQLEAKLEPESRDGIEYFVVIVADGTAVSDVDAEREWLFGLSAELQTLNFQNDPTKVKAEQTIRRYLAVSGYKSNVRVSVDRFKRHPQPRS